MEPLMTIKQVADVLNSSRATVYNIINRGEINVKRLGKNGAIRIAKKDFTRYLNSIDSGNEGVIAWQSTKGANVGISTIRSTVADTLSVLGPIPAKGRR